MGRNLVVTDVRFVPAKTTDKERGCLGWVSCHVNGIRVDGICLRFTRRGQHAISLPSRRDASGQQHPYSRMPNAAAMRDFEWEILMALGLWGGAQ